MARNRWSSRGLCLAESPGILVTELSRRMRRSQVVSPHDSPPSQNRTCRLWSPTSANPASGSPASYGIDQVSFPPQALHSIAVPGYRGRTRRTLPRSRQFRFR
jgi:hypothetical protein